MTMTEPQPGDPVITSPGPLRSHTGTDEGPAEGSAEFHHQRGVEEARKWLATTLASIAQLEAWVSVINHPDQAEVKKEIQGSKSGLTKIQQRPWLAPPEESDDSAD